MSKTLKMILSEDSTLAGELDNTQLQESINSAEEYTDSGEAMAHLSEIMECADRMYDGLSNYDSIDATNMGSIMKIKESMSGLMEEMSTSFDFGEYVDMFGGIDVSSLAEGIEASELLEEGLAPIEDTELQAGLEDIGMSQADPKKIKDKEFDSPVEWVFGIEMRSGHYADVFVGQYKGGKFFVDDSSDDKAKTFSDVKSLIKVLKTFGYKA